MRYGWAACSLTTAGLLALATVPLSGCQDDGFAARQLQEAQMLPWAEVQSVGALVDGAGRRVCSGVALGGNDVLTSARCAQAAVAGRLIFAASPGGQRMHRHPLAAVQGGMDAGAHAGRPPPATLAAHASTFQRLARRCQAEDILGLGLSAPQRLCAMRRMDAKDLQKMEVMGLGNWRDQGRLMLDAGLSLPAIRPFPHVAPPPGATLWVVGTRGLRRDHGSVQRYFAAWREVDHNASEIHAESVSGHAVVDIGAGLFVEVGPQDAPSLQLWGVASRPYVAHGDASAGMIFSRLFAPRPAG